MAPFSSCAIGTAATEQYDRRYSPDEAERVGENFVASGGVERSAFGILDARVGVEGSLFGAASVGDALRPGQRVHVLEIKIEVARKRAESCAARGVRQTGLRR